MARARTLRAHFTEARAPRGTFGPERAHLESSAVSRICPRHPKLLKPGHFFLENGIIELRA